MPVGPRKARNIRQVFFVWMLTVSLLALMLLTGYGLFLQYRHFHQGVELIRQQYQAEAESLLRDKVNEAVAFARHKAQTTEVRLKDEIRNRVDEGWKVAQHLYESHKGKKTEAEIRHLIKEVLRPVRFKQGRGYFFIVSLDGVEELYPTRPELEGKNLWDLQDIKGKYVIRDEIKTVLEKGEGFVSGYWPNPMVADDNGSLEISYVRIFKPLNWLIGTGEFVDNLRQEVQTETLDWLAKIRHGNGSYIFANTYAGDALLMNGRRASPVKNMWNLKDPSGVLIVQEETRIAKEHEDGGFLNYAWLQPQLQQAVPKMAFVKAIPEWEWVVGSSVALDDIEEAIAEKRAILQQNVHWHIGLILGGLLLTTLIVLLAALYVARKFDGEFQVFLNYFRSEKNQPDEIPTDHLAIREFEFLAEAANGMIRRQRETEADLKLLSHTDPLTGLANRRAMSDRIELETTRSHRNGQPISFVLIDIDLFKAVNDTYGHDIGDKVLQRFARLLQVAIRGEDLICRWGGEEFLLLAPDTPLEGAVSLAEKVRQMVMSHRFEVAGSVIEITVTCGVSMAAPGKSAETAIAGADRRLLIGKRRGRNQVVSKVKEGAWNDGNSSK